MFMCITPYFISDLPMPIYQAPRGRHDVREPGLFKPEVGQRPGTRLRRFLKKCCMKQGFDVLVLLGRPREKRFRKFWSRSSSENFQKIVFLERHRLRPTYGLKSPRPRTSCRPLEAWYEVRISKLNYKMNVSI